MATDFWASTHYKRWIVDRASVKQARLEDLRYVDDPEHLDFLSIYFANLIHKLCKKLLLRQRVIATATVFFRRFYLKNSYCDTDPFIVLAACCYVAAKAEESPVHIKNVVTESRNLFSQDMYGYRTFPTENSKLAEMEFYLVDDLECDLVVFHPYRTLLTLCRKPNSTSSSNQYALQELEAGEFGVGMDYIDEDEGGKRCWATGAGQLELGEGALEAAWFIINDTYRSDLCLLYEPHLIAIAALYLTLILHKPTQATVLPLLSSSSLPNNNAPGGTNANTTRRTSRQQNTSAQPSSQDPITFLADLNVSLPIIANIAQEIISLYTLWERYKEDGGAAQAQAQGQPFAFSPQSTAYDAPTPEAAGEVVITPAFLSGVLSRMRESRSADVKHPVGGTGGRVIPMTTSASMGGTVGQAVNKRLERTLRL